MLRTFRRAMMGSKKALFGKHVVGIQNPVSGTEGIFTVNFNDGGSASCYCMIDANGDQWALISQYTTSVVKREWHELVMKEGTINPWSQDNVNYPSVPTGLSNHSSKIRFRNANPAWISFYNTEHISFDTMVNGQVLGIAGIPAKKANGSDATVWATPAGWFENQVVGQPGIFGLWTQWGNSGPCGGSNNHGTNKICPFYDPVWGGPHGDYSGYQKQLFIKIN